MHIDAVDLLTFDAGRRRSDRSTLLVDAGLTPVDDAYAYHTW
jgi:hypothetical protein